MHCLLCLHQTVVCDIGHNQNVQSPPCSEKTAIVTHYFVFYLLLFTTVLSQRDFSEGKFGLPSPGKASCTRVAPPNLGCMLGVFSVSIIHRTLTRTTGSLTCAQMLMHAITHEGVRTHVRESAPKVDSRRKIPCRTGESNLRQQRDGPILYQLSYIPTPVKKKEIKVGVEADCNPSATAFATCGRAPVRFFPISSRASGRLRIDVVTSLSLSLFIDTGLFLWWGLW